MLQTEVKEAIQKAYSQFLEAKSLKPRYGQKLMIAEIARSLSHSVTDDDDKGDGNQHICVVEAGTGTGKTVAYLLATLPIAKALNKRVVLATATIALQEQVVLKDIPDVLHHSGLEFDFCLAKGRGRYLCLSKLDRSLSSNDNSQLIPVYEDEVSVINEQDGQLYQKMMAKLAEGKWKGDRDDWDDEIEASAWQRVTTDHRQCTGRRCSHVRNCAFFNARDALAECDLVVANHDLVLADLALGGGAILPAPEETIYIFDEGHHLPDKALSHFAHNVRVKSTIRWLGQSEAQWPNLMDPLGDATYFTELARPLETILRAVRKSLEDYLPMFQKLVDQELAARPNSSQKPPCLRFENGIAPRELEVMAEQMRDSFGELCRQLARIYDELNTLIDEDYPTVPRVDCENLYSVVGAWMARAEASLGLWSNYVQTQRDESWPFARWISVLEFNDAVDFEIVASPILAARTLAEGLWSRCKGAVVTSATLTALNSFERFIYRAGTYADSTYARVPSPFNFTENAELRIPADAVEANDAHRHTESIVDSLPNIIDKNTGTLVLFSSKRQMLDVSEQLPRSLQKTILMQGVESKQALVKLHKQSIDEGRGSIIFGLASFAEGVDLPGRYCEHVIIAKIPFAVPDNPLEAALAEWIESRGGNAFMEVSVPDASMRLIQASGRLLRTESDRGTITILDKRLISKRYGKALLQALPPFKMQF